MSGDPVRQDFHDRSRSFASGIAWLVFFGSIGGGVPLAMFGHGTGAVIGGIAVAVIGGAVGAAWVTLEWRRAGEDPTIRYRG